MISSTLVDVSTKCTTTGSLLPTSTREVVTMPPPFESRQSSNHRPSGAPGFVQELENFQIERVMIPLVGLVQVNTDELIFLRSH